MSNFLCKRSNGCTKSWRVRPAVAALASAILPGLGQFLNGDSSRALGVFLTWFCSGAAIFRWVPLIGVVTVLAWLYGVSEAFLTAQEQRERR